MIFLVKINKYYELSYSIKYLIKKKKLKQLKSLIKILVFKIKILQIIKVLNEYRIIYNLRGILIFKKILSF